MGRGIDSRDRGVEGSIRGVEGSRDRGLEGSRDRGIEEPRARGIERSGQKIEGSWEMIDFYSKKREQEDKEGPGANGEWVDLKMEIEGYDLEPEGYELQVEPPPARQVKVEPE